MWWVVSTISQTTLQSLPHSPLLPGRNETQGEGEDSWLEAQTVWPEKKKLHMQAQQNKGFPWASGCLVSPGSSTPNTGLGAQMPLLPPSWNCSCWAPWGISLSTWVSCAICVPLQALVHPDPTHLEGTGRMRNRESLSTAFTSSWSAQDCVIQDCFQHKSEKQHFLGCPEENEFHLSQKQCNEKWKWKWNWDFFILQATRSSHILGELHWPPDKREILGSILAFRSGISFSTLPRH